MVQDAITVGLSVSDVQTLLSVIKATIGREKQKDETDREVVEMLTLLYEDLNRQLQDETGQDHAKGMYSTEDDR